MTHGRLRPLVIACAVAVLCCLVLHLVAGTLCLSARSVSGCKRCCQSSTPSESQARVSACSLFCCTGLPGTPEVPAPPVLSLTVSLAGMHDLSICLAPAPPPPKSVLSIDAVVCDRQTDSETMEGMI